MCATKMAVALGPARVQTGRLACVVAVWFAVLTGLAAPDAAQAGWPLAQGATLRLAFGASYSSQDGTAATHRGVDLAAEAGARVLAPLAGHVTFAGSVPAVGGGTERVVTLETARGAITLMPLARCDVARGAELAEGDGVGVLAAIGDASSSAPHLHVGAHRGDLYIDPLGIISPPIPTPADEPQPQAAGEGARAGSAAPAGVGAHAGASAAAGVHAPAANPAAGGVTAPVAHAPGAVTRSASGGTVQGEELKTGAAGSNAFDTRSFEAGVRIAPGVTLSGSTAAGTAASAGATRVLAIAGPPVPVAGSSAANARWVEPASAGIGALATQAQQLAARVARTGKVVALGSLAALAMLWPLWRGSTRIGIGKVGVRAMGDDIAPVPSR